MPNTNHTVSQAYHNLQQQNASVILLHPNSQYRSLLIARLLHDPVCKTYYYALNPDDISVRIFVESLTRNLSNQFPLFGRHLNLLPTSVYDEFHANEDLVMSTIRRELSDLSDQQYYFVLDEYDRSDQSDDIHRFIELLAHYLPPHCKLVLNGRTLPRLPWLAMIARQEAAILLDDQIINKEFYGTPQLDRYDVYATSLGPGQVRVNDTLIDSWEGHLPRLLFFFALDRPVVTRSEICKSFWPELESDQAVNVFHVTKRRLHKALDTDILLHNDTHYRVNPTISVYYDATEFVEKLVEGRDPHNKQRYESWKRAIEIYTGPYLQGHDEKWIRERRDAYRTGYLEAITNTAQYWIDRDRRELAIRFYEQGLAADFFREDIHRSLMQLYAYLGRRSEAVAHFKEMDTVYRRNKRTMQPETLQLYSDIMA
jgi:DNA-binding SARP family transcriptional activator